MNEQGEPDAINTDVWCLDPENLFLFGVVQLKSFTVADEHVHRLRRYLNRLNLLHPALLFLGRLRGHLRLLLLLVLLQLLLLLLLLLLTFI